MQHIHHGSCGCGDDARGRLDLYSINETLLPKQIHCLNENEANQGYKVICTPFSDRANGQVAVSSLDDQELIFNINFDQSIVSLKGLIIHSKYITRQPHQMKIYLNTNATVDFSTIGNYKPVHHSTLLDFDPEANKPILFRHPTFKNVTNMTIHLYGLHPSGSGDVVENIDEGSDSNNQQEKEQKEKVRQCYEDSDGQIMVNYIGLLGCFIKAMRVPPKTTYEIKPQVGDHQRIDGQVNNNAMGFGL